LATNEPAARGSEQPEHGAKATGASSYKWLVLGVVGLGTFMSALDGSIVNTIVPLIREQYQATMGDISWVSAAYLLVISSLLLSIGRLGDIWGFKCAFSARFAIFGAGSLLCGLAPTLPALIGARVVQGTGAAVLMAIGPALITSSFPGTERGRALGLQATLTYTGLTLGPSLGGWIAGQFSWHWAFLINVPVAAIGVALAISHLRATERRGRQRFDLIGALTFAAGLTGLLVAMSQAESWGWGSGKTLLFVFGGLLLLLLFVRQERRTEQPMLPLWLFRNRVFSGGVVAAYLQYAATFMLTFLLPFYLQQFRGLSPAGAGAVMTAQPAVMVAVAGLAGWLSDKVGTRGPATLGMAVTAAGLWLLSRSGAATPYGLIMLFLGLVGLGSGLFTPPNNSSILGAAPRERQGIASALLAAARNVGMVSGIAFSSTLFTLLQRESDFLAAFRDTLAGAVGLAALSAVLSLLRPTLPRGKQE